MNEDRRGEVSSSGAFGRVDRAIGLDLARCLAAVAIVLFHFTYAYAPLMPETLSLSTAGGWFLLDLGPWLAPVAISMFVVLAGSGIVMGRASQTYRSHMWLRLTRLMVPLWVVAPIYLVAGVLTGAMSLADLWKVPIWLSGASIVSPATFRPVVEAWWFVTLAVQIALLGPVLRRGVERYGILRLSAILMGCNYAVLWAIERLAGEWGYLRVGLAPARFPEVVLGMSVGLLLSSANVRSRVEAVLSVVLAGAALALRPAVFPTKAAVGPIGFVVSPADVAVGFAAIAILVALTAGRRPGTAAIWAGKASALTYVLYLTHSPLVKYPVILLGLRDANGIWLSAVVAVAGSIAVAVAFQALVTPAVERIRMVGSRAVPEPGAPELAVGRAS